MSATTQCAAPIFARWVRVADTKLKMSWQFVSARADIYQIFGSAYVEIYYGIFLHTKWDYVRHKNHNHTSKKLGKWPNRDRTTPSPMALFGHYLAKNHPTKNAIEQKYSPRAGVSSGHAPWRCPADLPFHGFPPALLTFFYIMNREQGSRSG